MKADRAPHRECVADFRSKATRREKTESIITMVSNVQNSLQSQRTPAERALGGDKGKEGEEGYKMRALQIRKGERESLYKHVVCKPYKSGTDPLPQSPDATWSVPLAFLPCKALKPCRGTLDEPVTN